MLYEWDYYRFVGEKAIKEQGEMGRVEQSLEVNVPIEECYRTLTHFEDFPKFMKNVESIRQKGGPNVWQWQVKGPEGHVLTWDLEIMGMRHRNNIISWQTIRDADIAHSGAVTLKSIDSNRTRIDFVLQYNEEVGSMAELGGLDPQFINNSVRENLEGLKNMLEQKAGVSAGGGGGVGGQEQQERVIAPDDIPYSI
jgi:uncharacterized membrane protein